VPARAQSNEPPGQNDARIALIKRLLRANRFDDAEMVARTLATEYPQLARATAFYGLALHKQKKYGAARPLLERAIESPQDFPEKGHLPHFLGWCCYYTGDAAAAQHYFEIHAANWPNFDDTFYGLGVIALDDDRVGDAEEAFSNALRIQQAQPDDRRAIAKTTARLGDVAMRQDRPAVAMERYERAVELWPDHYEAWARLVRLYHREGREEDAVRAEAMEQKARERMGRADATEHGTLPDHAADDGESSAPGAADAPHAPREASAPGATNRPKAPNAPAPAPAP